MEINKNINIEEDEIDLKELFSTIKRNISMVFIVTFLSIILAIVYLYYSKSIYSSSTIISLDGKSGGGLGIGAMLSQVGFGDMGLGGGGNSDIEKAKTILTSKKFLKTILYKLNIDREYFILKNFRKVEVDNFPNFNIEVEIYDKDIYGKIFKIKPINDLNYLLEVDGIDYSQKLQYNMAIENSHFKIKVKKVNGIDPYDINITTSNLISKIIDSNFNLDEKRYLFKTLDENMQLEKLIENLSIEDKKSNILEIKYQDTIPSRAYKVASNITNSFIDFQLKDKDEEYNRNLGIVNTYIKDISKDIDGQIKKIEKFQTNNIIAVNIDSQELVNSIYTKKQNLEKILLQISEVDNFINALKHGTLSSVLLTNVGIDIMPIQKLLDNYISIDSSIRELELQKLNIDKSVTSNPLIESFIKELKSKRDLLYTLLTDFTEEHPQVIKQKEEIEALVNKINRNIYVNLNKLRDEKRVITSTILTNISMLKRNLLKNVSLLKDEIKKEEKILNSIPPSKIASDTLNKKFKFNERIYTALLNRKIDIEIDKSSLIANTKILEDAYIPEKRDKPKVGLILVVSAISGFIIGIFLIFLREFSNRKIRDISDIERVTDIPICGTIPKTNSVSELKGCLIDIKTNIALNSPKLSSRVIQITSIKDEYSMDRATISINMSQIIAESRERVLLIDFDFKRAYIHKKFKRENRFNILDYLSGDIKIEDLIESVDKYLDIITANNSNIYSVDLLLSDKFLELLNILKSRYRYIVLNTPSKNRAETKILFRYSDMKLFVFKQGISTIDEVEELKRLTLKDDLDGVGIILN